MILTYTGKMFDYNNIDVNSIDLEDIFHSLTRINRFNGHSIRPYSVAEHSIYCYLMADKLGYSTKQLLQVLMHDFTEAYVGDCPSPLKKLLPQFTVIEKNVEKAILQKFSLPTPSEEEYELIKRVDMTMLLIEMRDLTLHDYSALIDGSIEESMLNDKEFVLKKKKEDEKDLYKTLSLIFDYLINKYRKEEGLDEI